MRRIGKPVVIIVAVFIFLFTALSIFGIHNTWGDTINSYIRGVPDIRWGMDIHGGTEVIFEPKSMDSATAEQLNSAETIIKQRLISQNIIDSEVHTDIDKMRIVVRFPWPANTTNFNLDSIIKSIGQKADLTFRKGTDKDYSGDEEKPKGEIILTGSDVVSATAASQRVSLTSPNYQYVVNLKLNEEGKQKFADATRELAASKDKISIWLDNDLISAPSVNDAITDGNAAISGNFTPKTASQLANTISSGSLPIELKTASYSTISPTLGIQAKNMIKLAAVIAFLIIAAFMIWRYRIPGIVATISLIGHIGLTIAAISGFFSFFSNFTLTLPGVAGIILGIGMAVDANILTASRITEELNTGRSIDGAIAIGSKRGFAAILDGNIIMLILSIILMGAFGPQDSLFAFILKPLFFIFGATTEGAIFSFGYTMFIGVICNLIFSVFCTRVMLRSLSKFKRFRDPKLYGGAI